MEPELSLQAPPASHLPVRRAIRPILIIAATLAALASPARAGTAATDTATSTTTAQANDRTAAFEFAAEVPVAVSITLWPTGLRSGPMGPLFDEFQALVLFSGETSPLRCALSLPQPDAPLQPGQTATLALRCSQPFRVLPGSPGFRLLAGARPLGVGELRAAARAQVMGDAGGQP